MPETPPKAAAEPAAKTLPARPAKTAKVKVAALLGEDTILTAAAGQDKPAILEALVRQLCAARGLGDPAAFLAKALEREQGISTTLDTGLSLPHARMDGLNSIVAGLALVPQGVPDPKQADLQIRVMFLFFSPNKTDSFPLHLQLLRGVSSVFQPALIDSLLAAPSPAAVLDLLRRAEG